MKRFFLFMVLLASIKCNAATGNASDGELALIAIITILLLPIAVLYFIKFMKSRIHDIRTKRMFRNHFIGHNGEI